MDRVAENLMNVMTVTNTFYSVPVRAVAKTLVALVGATNSSTHTRRFSCPRGFTRAEIRSRSPMGDAPGSLDESSASALETATRS